jgi:prolyl-tRNA editing enzyme YbaK/EbsC (Cys-tRNA(Pro) deacylase)
MSLDSVRAFLQVNAPDIELIETGDSSATVELAAKVHGVEPAQIAKTICLRVGDKTLLIVASGIARLDNRKVKDVLGGKGRMLDPEQVLTITGHSVGGVCPFGLLSPLPVYCDISLRRFKEVVPAAGSTSAALRIATERLAELTGAIGWMSAGNGKLRRVVAPPPGNNAIIGHQRTGFTVRTRTRGRGGCHRGSM